MSLKVLGEEECRALGMGSYLAVAQGSKDGPEFIHLTYTPKGEPARCVTSTQSPHPKRECRALHGGGVGP
jgi:leucyl aminopeptidase